MALYQRAVFEEVARPLHPSEADELGWFFKESCISRPWFGVA